MPVSVHVLCYANLDGCEDNRVHEETRRLSTDGFYAVRKQTSSPSSTRHSRNYLSFSDGAFSFANSFSLPERNKVDINVGYSAVVVDYPALELSYYKCGQAHLAFRRLLAGHGTCERYASRRSYGKRESARMKQTTSSMINY